MSEEAAKEYQCSLEELTFNSKLHINVLTMIAQENFDNGYADQIVKVIESHLSKAKADRKMPVLYLMDSIMKNMRESTYASLFTPNIVANFAMVFEKVDEKKRQSMYKLRQTWTDIFPNFILYALDRKINELDPAWPITARQEDAVSIIPGEAIEDQNPGSSHVTEKPAEQNPAPGAEPGQMQPSIHVNPKFLLKKRQQEEVAARKKEEEQLRSDLLQKQKELETRKRQREEEQKRKKFEEEAEMRMKEEMMLKQQELMRLQQQKLELELEETRRNLKQKEIELKRKAELDRIRELEREKAHQKQLDEAKKLTEKIAKKKAEEAEKQRRDEENRRQREAAADAEKRERVEAAKRRLEAEAAARSKALGKPEPKSDPRKASSSRSRDPRDPRRANADPRRSNNNKNSTDSKRRSATPTNSDSSKNHSPKSKNGASQNFNEPKKQDPSSFRKDRSSRQKGASKAERRYRRSQPSSGSEEEDTLEIRPRHNRSTSPGRRKRKLSPSGTEVGRNKKSTSAKNLNDLKKAQEQNSKQDENKARNSGEPMDTSEKESKLQNKKESGDILELFGTVDVDYRSLPPIPKKQVLPESASDESLTKSPSVAGWSKHKESRPDAFVFRQPRRMSIDSELRSSVNAIRGNLPGYEESQPSNSSLTNPDEILKFAELQYSRGILNREQYDELLIQLQELARLQKLRVEARQQRENQRTKQQMPHLKPPPKPPLMTSPGARRTLLPLPDTQPISKAKNLSFHDESSKSPKDFDTTKDSARPAKKPLLPPPVPPRVLLETPPEGPGYNEEDSADGRPPHQRPLLRDPPPRGAWPDKGLGRGHHPQDRRPYPDPNYRPRMRERGTFNSEFSPGPRFRGGPPFPTNMPGNRFRGPPNPNNRDFEEQQSNGQALLPLAMQEPWFDMSEFYVPEFDKRWYRRAHFPHDKKSLDSKFELLVNGRSFQINVGSRNGKMKKVPFNGMFRTVFLDPETFELLIDGQVYYRLHEPERQVMIGGSKFMIYLRGPPTKLWIDGHQFEIRVDSPPESVLIANVSYDLLIDRQRKAVVVDNHPVCPWDPTQIHDVVLGKGNQHTFQFSPPSRTILIDGEECELDLSQRYPAVHIKGQWHGICFTGPPQDLVINGQLYSIALDTPRKVYINNRPYLAAIGGPGHEVIIADEWYEVKFDGPPVSVNLGGFKPVTLQLPGSRPDVKILGVVTRVEDIEKVAGSCPVEYASEDEDIDESLSRSRQEDRGSAQNLDAGRFSQQSGAGLVKTETPSIPAALAAAPVNVDELFSKLLSSGIIKKVDDTSQSPKAGSSPAQVTHRDSPVPMATGSQETTSPGPTGSGNTLAQALAGLGPTPIVIQPVKEEQKAPEGEKSEENSKAEGMSEKEKKDLFAIIPWMGDLDLNKLKIKQKGVIDLMYTGIQCTSCAARFRPDQTTEYKEHLDWHFRQNKREKQDSKVVRNRRWFYEISDWVAFEEIGDVEERVVSNYFENMLHSIQSAIGGAATQGGGNAQGGADQGGKVQEPCPIASANDEENMCEICRDPFEQFYDDEEEEWHLRDAMRVNGRAYHPVCYEDFKEQLDGDGESSEETAMETSETTPDTNPDNNPDTTVTVTTTVTTTKTEVKVEQKASSDQAAETEEKDSGSKPGMSRVASNPILDMVTNPLAYLNALSQKAKEIVNTDENKSIEPTKSTDNSSQSAVSDNKQECKSEKSENCSESTDKSDNQVPNGSSTNENAK